MFQDPVSGPPRRDPFFVILFLLVLVIAAPAERGVFLGVKIQHVLAASRAGGSELAILDWIAVGPLLGGLIAYFLGRHLTLVVGGIGLLGSTLLFPFFPTSPLPLMALAMGYGFFLPCLFALAAFWLPNELGNARLALFCFLALTTDALYVLLPPVISGEGAGFFITSFAGLALMCAVGLAALDFWAGRGYDRPRAEEKKPSRAKLEALGLATVAAIFSTAAATCAYQQHRAALDAWQGHELGWLDSLGTVIALSLLVVGVLTALMGTFMGLPRLGLAAALPFVFVMGCIAVLCGNVAASSQEPLIAFGLLATMAAGFLQLGMVPVIAALAGGFSPRFVPLAIGLYLGLGGPVFGHLFGSFLADSGKALLYPFAFLLLAAAIVSHFLGRRADAALENV